MALYIEADTHIFTYVFRLKVSTVGTTCGNAYSKGGGRIYVAVSTFFASTHSWVGGRMGWTSGRRDVWMKIVA